MGWALITAVNEHKTEKCLTYRQTCACTEMHHIPPFSHSTAEQQSQLLSRFVIPKQHFSASFPVQLPPGQEQTPRGSTSILLHSKISLGCIFQELSVALEKNKVQLPLELPHISHDAINVRLTRRDTQTQIPKSFLAVIEFLS